jgi:ferric-dicitrate binding protein FerR (iron transport regulator)
VNHFDKFSELIGKHLAGETTQAEQQDLFTWLEAEESNRKFFEELEQVWAQTADAATTPFDVDMDAAWSKIDLATHSPNLQTQLPNPHAGRVAPLSKFIRRWSIAAAILVALGIGLWWLTKTPDESQLIVFQTVKGEKREIILPDSSQVWLNENSSLTYDSHFEKRQVTLVGEAFFQVERLETSPFEISSGETKTTVLGTSFNVRAYPAEDKIEVTVESGKVAFEATNHKKSPVLLEAGASGVFNKKEKMVRVEEKKIINANAWKTKRLVFDEALLKDVFESLERYFDVKIEVSNPLILECHYSTTFNQPDLESILAVISSTFGLEVSQTGGKYALSGKGCLPNG